MSQLQREYTWTAVALGMCEMESLDLQLLGDTQPPLRPALLLSSSRPRFSSATLQLQHWAGQRHQGLGRGRDGHGRGRVREAYLHPGLRVRCRRVR